MKILLAFNGSKLSETALHTVITRRRPENPTVKVLKVIPLDITEEEVRQAQASLDLTAQALQAAGFKAESMVLPKIVLESIIGVAEDWDADLIVLGCHGRKTVSRLLFGRMRPG